MVDALEPEPGLRGTENRPAVAQMAGVFATKSAEVERYKRGLAGEDWHLIKPQRGISSSSELLDSYLSLIISMIYWMRVVDDMGLEPTTSALRTRRSPD